MILASFCESPIYINLFFANCLRPAQCFVPNLQVRVLVSEVSDKFSFETFQYGALSFSFSDLSSAEFFFPSNVSQYSLIMTSTILLSLSGLIFIFASASNCKQSFKIFSKISSHPVRPQSTYIRPCRHAVSCCFSGNRCHSYFMTPIKLMHHQLTVIVLLSQIQDSSKQANLM